VSLFCLDRYNDWKLYAFLADGSEEEGIKATGELFVLPKLLAATCRFHSNEEEKREEAPGDQEQDATMGYSEPCQISCVNSNLFPPCTG
jgi:hypothetical protein